MENRQGKRLGYMNERSNFTRLVLCFHIAIFSCLILAILFPASVHAQKRPELPAKLDAYEGKYPNRFMKLPAVRTRLRALLGKYYDDFIERMGVQGEFGRKGDILSVEGLMPHMGGSEDAILVIDLKSRTLHCGLYSDGTVGFITGKNKKKSGLLEFSETPAAIPDVLKDWSN